MRKQWLTVAGANLLLGVPGVVPGCLLVFIAVNWPLAAIGLTRKPELTENDGLLPWLLLAAVVVALYVLVWEFVNRALRRRMAPLARCYWPVSVLTTLVPSFALMGAYLF